MMKKTSKMYASGGRMKSKGYAQGGKTDKLEMVEKDGKMVPFFAADGEGKMSAGGMVPKTKGYFKGGRALPSTMPGLGNPNPSKSKGNLGNPFFDDKKKISRNRKRPGQRPGAKRGGKG